MLAFTYILLTVIMALTVPLAINLAKRTSTELESDAIIKAQEIAATIDRADLSDAAALASVVTRAPGFERVVIVDQAGTVLADSSGTAVGGDYDNAQRPEIQAALRGAPLADRRFSDTREEEILVAAAPIWQGDRVIGAARVTRSIQDVSNAVRRTTLGLIVVGLAGLLAGAAIAFGLASSLARPLTRLVDAARRLGSGDLRARTGEVQGPRELEDLAHSFDEMAERVERGAKAQREFVANASHQLRTPLTGMKLRLESAIADAPNEEVKRQLTAAEREVDRLGEIVDRLMVMARRIEEGAPATLDLIDAARSAVERWQDRAHRANGEVSVVGESAAAVANPGDVDQILDALLDNAMSHAPGPVEIRVGSNDGRAFLAVRDHGPGIPAEERQKVTERFYRGRNAAPGGSGLGLAIVRDLAETWGGGLAVEEAAGGGTRMVVRLRTPRGEEIE